MLSYLVIGICILLLVAVIYISAKPISMGIEARRNNRDNNDLKEHGEFTNEKDFHSDESNISAEIIKLHNLMKDGVLTKEEYEKAKMKLLS